MTNCWFCFAACLLLCAQRTATAENGVAPAAYGPNTTSPRWNGNVQPATAEVPVQQTQPSEKLGDHRLLGSRKSSENEAASSGALGSLSNLTGKKSIYTVLFGLTIVLGVFFLFAWVVRKGMPAANGRLPKEVVKVLGQAPLMGKNTVHLVQLGNKLLLISIMPTGVETLSEITDPDEVTRLIGLCGQQTGGSQAAFQQVFQELGHGQEKPVSKWRSARA